MLFCKRNKHEISEIYYEIVMINYEIFIMKHEINTTKQHLGWNLEPHPPHSNMMRVRSYMVSGRGRYVVPLVYYTMGRGG